MPDLLDGDLVRVVAAVQTLTLVALSVFVMQLYREITPAPIRHLLMVLIGFVALVTAAVTANVLTGIPPTPGVYVVAFGSLPAVVLIVAVVLRIVSHTDHD
jgi:hypothetical protein